MRITQCLMRHSRSRRWTKAAGVVLLLLVALLAAGCNRGTPSPVSMEDVREEEAPDQESWNVRFYINNDDVPRVHIEAGYMAKFEVNEDSTYILLEQARGDLDSLGGQATAYLFDADGDSSAVLTADRLYYYEQERRMEARGRVYVVTRDDKQLESEHLVWLEEEREVRTEGFVLITTPQERIQGYDLVADENLDTYRINRITGQVQVDE